MAKTSTTKRRKLDPETKQKQEFKKRFKPLIDDFYQFKSVSLIDAFLGQYRGPVSQNKSDHPLLFLHIKEKFEMATYDNIEQLVEDLRRITRRITTGARLIDAKYLDSYIERAIEPISHAEGIIQLYHTKTKSGKNVRLQLDLNYSLAPGQGHNFYTDFNIEDRLKMSLSWPLPAITFSIDSTKIATASLTEPKFSGITTRRTAAPIQTLGNNQGKLWEKELQAKKVKLPRKWTDHTFEVDGTVYDAGVTLLSEAFKFNIYINGDNKVTRSRFVATYVDRYLKSDPLKSLDWRWAPAPSQHTPEKAFKRTDNDQRMRWAAGEYLYDGIKALVLASLDHHKQKFLPELEELNKRLPYFENTSFSSDEKETTELESFFRNGQLSEDMSSFGLLLTPVLVAGYWAKIKGGEFWPSYQPVVFTAIGEVKYVTFDLLQCIKDLEGSKKWNKEFATIDDNRRRSRIKELENTLYKYTTACVHLGFPRYVLSDYNCFLFVKLEFQDDKTQDDYGTSLSEVGEYIKAQYSYFTLDDPYIRLYVSSFFIMNQELIDETAEFKKLISESLKKEEEYLRNQQAESISKRMASGVNLDVGGRPVSVDSDAQSTGSLTFDKELLKKPSYLELGDVITEVISYGIRKSQVVKVNSLKFSKLIFEENMVVKGDLPETCVLKVFDPYQGHLIAYDPDEDRDVPVPYSYQRAIHYTVKEIKAYCKLSKYFGDFIPRLFAYGRLSDLYPGVGQFYCRLSGGYIMIEELKRVKTDPEFVITKEFFESKILRLFQAMHELDIVQNQKNDNAIITSDGGFYIIDFSRCLFTDSDADKKAEIDRVYDKYGQRSWR